MNASQEKVLRQKLLDTFDKVTLKSFYELRPARAVWTFAHIWLGIVLALALGFWAWESEWWGAKLLIPFCVLYIGTRQNAFAVQIHEAAHHLLLPSRRWNDIFCDFFCAYWILNDTESYRRVHLMHHTDLHEATDPDRELYEITEQGGRYQIMRLVLSDLLWITAIRRIISYVKMEGGGSKGGVFHSVAKLICQGVLLTLTILSLGWWQGALFYFVFWLVPLFSIFPAIIRLRIVTEHFSPALSFPESKPFVSRTTCAHAVEIYLFGCDMEYHFEHHLLPTIPHAQLARLHDALVARGFFQTLLPAEDYLSGGYLRFWAQLLRGSLPQLEPVPSIQV